MMVERTALRDQIACALAQADALDDHLISALLSQCLALMEARERQPH